MCICSWNGCVPYVAGGRRLFEGWVDGGGKVKLKEVVFKRKESTRRQLSAHLNLRQKVVKEKEGAWGWDVPKSKKGVENQVRRCDTDTEIHCRLTPALNLLVRQEEVWRDEGLHLSAWDNFLNLTIVIHSLLIYFYQLILCLAVTPACTKIQAEFARVKGDSCLTTAADLCAPPIWRLEVTCWLYFTP